MTDAEAKAGYGCAKGEMTAAYAKSGVAVATMYPSWTNYANNPYPSATHGGRYVNNYANARGHDYAKYENVGVMPVGSVLAKDSFGVNAKGRITIGPLFLMEKMPAGFNSEFGDWRYSMIMPNGSVFGSTGGAGSEKVQFCADCHSVVGEDQDHLYFLPEEYRR